MPGPRAVFENRFPDVAEQQPELLAEHCGQAGWAEKAARLWRRARHGPALRAAHREASALFEKALTAHAALLPPSADTLGEAIDIRWDLHHSLYPLGQLGPNPRIVEEAQHIAEREAGVARLIKSNVYALGSLGELAGAVGGQVNGPWRCRSGEVIPMGTFGPI